MLKTEPLTDREVAIDAVDIVNDLRNDFVSSVGMWQALMKAKGVFLQFEQHTIDRVMLTHVVTTLFKVDEFLRHPRYSKLLGGFELAWRRSVRARIQDLGVAQIRNHYTGHIHGEDGRPIKASELDARYQKMGMMRDFLEWVALGDASVLHLLERIRSDLSTAYSINPEEVVGR